MISSFFIFVIVLGVLVVFHELGHFVVAKLFGVGVEKFSFGFGPRIFGCRIGMTDYFVSAIPLGGYVKMVGDDYNTKVDDVLVPFSFLHKHVFKKILIVFSGPMFNLFLAIAILFVIYVNFGINILSPTIGEVVFDMPAFNAGLEPGDTVVSINHDTIDSWNEMSESVSNYNGKPVEFGFRRGDDFLTALITPDAITFENKFIGYNSKYAIGVISAGKVISKKLNCIEAMNESVFQTCKVVFAMVLAILKMITGDISTESIGGPIMIAEMAVQQADISMVNLALFVALLSINLAVLNCLPIPVLDGGHLMFFIIEAIIGRPVSLKIREFAQQFGILILSLLMFYVFYKDLARFFSG